MEVAKKSIEVIDLCKAIDDYDFELGRLSAVMAA